MLFGTACAAGPRYWNTSKSHGHRLIAIPSAACVASENLWESNVLPKKSHISWILSASHRRLAKDSFRFVVADTAAAAPSQRNSMFNVQAVLQSLFGPVRQTLSLGMDEDFSLREWISMSRPKLDWTKTRAKKKNVRRFSRSGAAVFFWVLWGEVICFAFVEFVCWLRCRPELFFLTYFDSACLSAMALLIVSEGFWVNSSDGANEQGKQTTRWWFQMFFSFTTTWGNDPIWRACFSHGWFSHQLD